MDRTTTLAASITLTATMAFGTMAFAALGGSSVLSFESKAGAVAPGTAVEVAVTEPASVGENAPLDPAAGVGTSATATPATGATTARTAQVTVRPADVAPTTATTVKAITTNAVTTDASTTTVKSTTTASTTTVKATTTAPTTTVAAPVTTVKPQLYTVTGQAIPSNFSVPLSWRTKAIPAYPAGCRAGQLEDSGVWNCQ